MWVSLYRDCAATFGCACREKSGCPRSPHADKKWMSHFAFLARGEKVDVPIRFAIRYSSHAARSRVSTYAVDLRPRLNRLSRRINLRSDAALFTSTEGMSGCRCVDAFLGFIAAATRARNPDRRRVVGGWPQGGSDSNERPSLHRRRAGRALCARRANARARGLPIRHSPAHLCASP